MRKVWPARRPEVGRRLEHRGRHPLQRGLHRQDHVGQPDVDEDKKRPDIARSTANCPRSPAAARTAFRIAEAPMASVGPGDDAFLREDQLPGIDLDQIARPQRQHHAQVEGGLPAAPRIARGEIGDGKGDARHRPTVTAAAMPTVRRMMSKFDGRSSSSIGLEREFLDHHAGEFVDRIEALQKKRRERAEIDDPQPQQRRGEQQHRAARWACARTDRSAGRPSPVPGSVTSARSPRVLHHVQGVRREGPDRRWRPVSGTGWPGGHKHGELGSPRRRRRPGCRAQIAQGADRARQSRHRAAASRSASGRRLDQRAGRPALGSARAAARWTSRRNPPRSGCGARRRSLRACRPARPCLPRTPRPDRPSLSASPWSWVTKTKVMPQPLLQRLQLVLHRLAQLQVQRARAARPAAARAARSPARGPARRAAAARPTAAPACGRRSRRA